jgi:hypothetical protein
MYYLNRCDKFLHTSGLLGLHWPLQSLHTYILGLYSTLYLQGFRKKKKKKSNWAKTTNS